MLNISDEVMFAITIGSPLASGLGVYLLSKRDRKKQSAKAEIAAIKNDVRDIKEEMFEVRYAINELAAHVGNNIFFPTKTGARGRNGV